jgi:hypothetical protein
MHSHLNYLVAQQRQIELTCRAEQARHATETRPEVSASSPRWDLPRLLAPRRLRAASLAAAAQHASPGMPHECLGCGT